MKKKIQQSQEFIHTYSHLFQCPICHTKMQVSQRSLYCKNQHQFDLSKKGTLYFLNHQVKTEYQKEMFEHRRNMIKSGMYEPLLEFLFSYCEKEQLLDVGCGEGSFLQEIAEKSEIRPSVGFDISKEGIYLATEDQHNIFWCIADLTNLPFREQSFSTILNIFSPSNYAEFSRVLKKGGQVIKVVPQSGYLQELRQSFYPEDVSKQKYSNDRVVEKFQQAFSSVRYERITYTYEVPKEKHKSLLEMSPLEWGVSAFQKERVKQSPIGKVTIDLDVLIGKKE
ncbi:putative RNA methyltransferase [Tetragenococcus muriaticus]|uniref:Ribosomal RNA large subunit methyltransferase A n=2 Tax=Tetragenococcus muriaticus TaxID=64642 RepID=A0A091C631_9ENTE|nr:methyltransferase domain-containing protein [Tetragenococcus muriaticus]KFN92135.1 ribosomal RNA large subunit methyltransferase A [Tetragenococcus muriaticus 3MR10-3]KFN92830.1 ribosomal RNA large subunit methyltransferase A [Tetragenococcus muriaticus PMC-11-5]GMA47699.1 50S rRNA methyltransferase [Tetragenococcus muriaticus]